MIKILTKQENIKRSFHMVDSNMMPSTIYWKVVEEIKCLSARQQIIRYMLR